MAIWSDADTVRLRTMHRAGYSDSQIAQELGIERRRVQNKRHWLGLRPHKRAQSESSWSAEEDAELLRAREAGVSYRDIAAQLGRTHEACRRRRHVIASEQCPVDTSIDPQQPPVVSVADARAAGLDDDDGAMDRVADAQARDAEAEAERLRAQLLRDENASRHQQWMRRYRAPSGWEPGQPVPEL